MSELGFLERLLDGTEVEWKGLGEVAAQIYSGGTPDTKVAAFWDDGTIPWMSSGEVNLKTVYRTEKFISAEGLKNSSAKRIPLNSVVIALAGQGRTRGKVARTRIELTTNQSLAAIVCDPRKLSADYVFHFLDSQYEKLRQISSGNSGRGGLNLKLISDCRIPIPCPQKPDKSLAIQKEIVRILDSFIKLITELTAELELRKKQYNYYRYQLLTFKDDEVEWKMLGDENLFEIANRGRRPVKAALREPGPTPYYGANNIQDYVNGHTHEGEFVLIAEDGSASLEDYSIQYATGRFWANNHVHVVRGKGMVDTRYLFHILRVTNFQPFLSGGGRAKLTKGRLVEMSIPVPCSDDPTGSLAIQREIVRKLDKLDTLTTSVSEGLPREIELRQKQYEYYRDLLLGFPKPAETAET